MQMKPIYKHFEFWLWAVAICLGFFVLGSYAGFPLGFSAGQSYGQAVEKMAWLVHFPPNTQMLLAQQVNSSTKIYFCPKGDVGKCLNKAYQDFYPPHFEATSTQIIGDKNGTYCLNDLKHCLPPSTDYCKYLQDDCGPSPMFCGGVIGKEAAIKEFCPPPTSLSPIGTMANNVIALPIPSSTCAREYDWYEVSQGIKMFVGSTTAPKGLPPCALSKPVTSAYKPSGASKPLWSCPMNDFFSGDWTPKNVTTSIPAGMTPKDFNLKDCTEITITITTMKSLLAFCGRFIWESGFSAGQKSVQSYTCFSSETTSICFAPAGKCFEWNIDGDCLWLRADKKPLEQPIHPEATSTKEVSSDVCTGNFVDEVLCGQYLRRTGRSCFNLPPPTCNTNSGISCVFQHINAPNIASCLTAQKEYEKDYPPKGEIAATTTKQ